MLYYKGNQGIVKFSSTGGTTANLAQVTSWTMTVEKQTIDNTRINDTYASMVGGVIKGSGTVNLVYSSTSNSSFITAVNTPGDTGTASFELYVSTTGNKRILFKGVITKASYAGNSSEVATMSCDFVATGTITTTL